MLDESTRDWDGDATCYLYAIKCGPYTKVGITSNLRHRLKGIASMNPFKITRLFTRSTRQRHILFVEKHVHSSLAAYHHRGEWFLVPKDPLKVAVRRAMYLADRRETEFCIRRRSPDFDLWNRQYETVG